MMRNKKGQDFLNVVEIIVVIFCVIFAFWFLDLAKINSEQEAAQNVEEFQHEYKSIQALRSLAQTPLLIGEETMTFAQVLNKYFELLEYYTTQKSSLSSTRENEIKEQLTIYSHALEEATQNYVVPYFDSPTGLSVYIVADYVLFDTIDENKRLELGSIDSALELRKDPLPTLLETTLMLPAYFEQTTDLPGSYHIELSSLHGQGFQYERIY